MSAPSDRLDLRLSRDDKDRLRRAAELAGMPLAAFVREAALRQAANTIAHPPGPTDTPLSAQLRGRATSSLSTEQIMQLTRRA